MPKQNSAVWMRESPESILKLHELHKGNIKKISLYIFQTQRFSVH